MIIAILYNLCIKIAIIYMSQRKFNLIISIIILKFATRLEMVAQNNDFYQPNYSQR